MTDYPFGKKYLVQRHDGTVPEWPWFVLGACDPYTVRALVYYAGLVEEDITAVPTRFPTAAAKKEYVDHILGLARVMERYADNPTAMMVQEPERSPSEATRETLGMAGLHRCRNCSGVGRVAGIRCAPCDGEGFVLVPSPLPARIQ